MLRKRTTETSLPTAYGSADYEDGSYSHGNDRGQRGSFNGSNLTSPRKLARDRGGSGGNSTLFQTLPWLTTAALFFVSLYYRSQFQTTAESLSASEEQIDAMTSSHERKIREHERTRKAIERELHKAMEERPKQSGIDKQLEKLQKENQRLFTENKSLETELERELSRHEIISEQLEGVSMEKDDTVKSMVRREAALKARVEKLKEKISRESYREAFERFGPGPHHVVIEVDIPRDAEKDAQLPEGSHPSFTIELFPLDKMPHTVHLFLEQVHHKLWDGCSFVVNAPHILQVGALPGKRGETDLSAKMKAFEVAKLDSVSYQEYHEEYPHEQWTVGFAGRPGGPDFYINKINNTQNHGPGGQDHHDLHEEADPCFGKIVEGLDVIQRIENLPHKNAQAGFILNTPLHIVTAKIVPPVEALSES